MNVNNRKITNAFYYYYYFPTGKKGSIFCEWILYYHRIILLSDPTGNGATSLAGLVAVQVFGTH